MKEFNLKSFHVFYADDASALEKAALLNEIRTLKQAGRHPNIVNLIGAWVHGGKVSFDHTNGIEWASIPSLTGLHKKAINNYFLLKFTE